MIAGMRATAVVALAALLGVMGSAQNPPPICFAFNDASPPQTANGGISCLGFLTVHFVAPVNATVTEIDLWGSGATYSYWLQTVVYATSALGVPPTPSQQIGQL